MKKKFLKIPSISFFTTIKGKKLIKNSGDARWGQMGPAELYMGRQIYKTFYFFRIPTEYHNTLINTLF